MEKRTPHYDLNDVKEILLRRGTDCFTYTARSNAKLMGLDDQSALDVLLSLQRGMLFKEK